MVYETDFAPPFTTSEPGSPEQLVEERVARLVSEMIDLCILTTDPEQKPLVQAQWRGVSQILLRAKLLLSVFEGKDAEATKRLIVALDDAPLGKLRIVR